MPGDLQLSPMNKKDIVAKFLQKGVLLQPEALEKAVSLDPELLGRLAEELCTRGVSVAGAEDMVVQRPTATAGLEVAAPEIEVLTESYGSGSDSRVDYLKHFQNRFDRLAALIKQRVEAQFQSILDVRSRDARDSATIGMVFDRSTTKSGTPALVVEDGTGRMRVLVPKASESANKARSLVLDEVVGLEGRWDQSRKVFMADRIDFPDIDEQMGSLADTNVHAAFISDLHFGSPDFMEDSFARFVSWLRGEHGTEDERNLADLTKYVVICGDLIGDGPEGILEKYSGLARLLKQIPEKVRIFAIPGEMDTAGILEPQAGFLAEAARAFSPLVNFQHGGNPCLIRLGPVPVLMYHGRSLEDWAPRLDPNRTCEIMKEMLVRRHLAPEYGSGVPLSPTSKDPFLIGEVPRIFHMGHGHGACSGSYKGVLLLATPSWRTCDIEKHAGSAYVVDLSSLAVRQLSFSS